MGLKVYYSCSRFSIAMAKIICLLFFSFVSLHSVLALRRPRIIGGDYVDITKYPYQATLINEGDSHCGATIITDRWLITAGHCVDGFNITEIKARTGATKRYDDGEMHEIEETHVHPDLATNSYSISNDIALVKVKNPIVFSKKQQPIPLAEVSDEYPPGTIMTITGFGRDEVDSEKKILHLKVVRTPVVNFTKCQDDYFLDPVTENMICAGENGDSPCTGDSGGPAVVDGKLAGIISTGFRCDTTNVPAIFTAVNKYLDWISKYVKINQ